MTLSAVAPVDPGLPVVVVLMAVGVFALVQSLFGVGLLIFGTPTLLLVGLPFELVLAYLLPCSIVVSLLQVATSGGPTLEPIRRRFLTITAPAVLVTTAVALLYGSPRGIRALVGVMLLLTAAIRFGRLQSVLAGFIGRHLRPFMFGLGVVHGLSNLGGGILTVIVGSTHQDKESIRRHIAFAYGVMAAIQLAVVFLTTRPHLDLRLWSLLPLLAGGTYLLVGQRVFHRAGHRPYQLGLTVLIMSFGLLLVTNP
jgi:uncharacterized protein